MSRQPIVLCERGDTRQCGLNSNDVRQFCAVRLRGFSRLVTMSIAPYAKSGASWLAQPAAASVSSHRTRTPISFSVGFQTLFPFPITLIALLPLLRDRARLADQCRQLSTVRSGILGGSRCDHKREPSLAKAIAPMSKIILPLQAIRDSSRGGCCCHIRPTISPARCAAARSHGFAKNSSISASNVCGRLSQKITLQFFAKSWQALPAEMSLVRLALIASSSTRTSRHGQGAFFRSRTRKIGRVLRARAIAHGDFVWGNHRKLVKENARIHLRVPSHGHYCCHGRRSAGRLRATTMGGRTQGNRRTTLALLVSSRSFADRRCCTFGGVP